MHEGLAQACRRVGKKAPRVGTRRMWVLSKYGGMNPINQAEFQPVTVGVCV